MNIWVTVAIEDLWASLLANHALILVTPPSLRRLSGAVPFNWLSEPTLSIVHPIKTAAQPKSNPRALANDAYGLILPSSPYCP
jgi:hypothetical protein